MRKFLFASLFVALSVNSLCAQNSQWQQTNGPKSNDVIFGSDSVLFASNTVDLFVSSDHGVTWNLSDRGNSNSPIGDILSFASDGKYEFLGLDDATIIASSDKGNSWFAPDTSVTTPSKAWTAMLCTPNFVFAGTMDDGVYRLAGRNGNWVAVNSQMPKFYTTSLAEWRGMIFAASRSSTTFLSSNNGDHWTQTVISPSDSFAYTLATNSDYVFAGTLFGELYRSDDTGQSWIPLTSGAQGIASIAIDGDTVIAATSSTGLIRSTDNGDTWVSANTGMAAYDCGYVVSVDGNFFACALDGDYESTNSGLTWQSQAGVADNSIYSLASIGSIIFATPHGWVYQSTDSGARWYACGQPPVFPDNTGQPGAMTILAFNGMLYFAGNGYGVYRSNDSGQTWVASGQGLPLDEDLEAGVSYLVSVGDKLLAVQDDTIYTSLDSGLSWHPSTTFASKPLLLSVGGILLTQVSGQDMRSTDGGQTWENTQDSLLIESSSTASIGSTIFVKGTNTIYRSSDSGATWAKLTDPGMRVSEITANSSSILYAFSAVGRGTSWYYSTDLGDNWQLIADSIPFYPQVVTMNDGYMLAGAQCDPNQTIGGVWRYQIDLPLQVQNNSNISPIEIEVYPNPLESSTNIHYSLEHSTAVTITLFDPLGREVLKPISGEWQDAGEHEVTIDSRNLAPGIYECRLNAGDSVMTAKMIVVR